jgi:hypothetical protein
MASSSNPEPPLEERIKYIQTELERIKELVKE